MKRTARFITCFLLALLASSPPLWPQAAAIGQPAVPGTDPNIPAGPGAAGGIADVAFQGYYFGGNSQPLNGLSGAATAFRSFFPGIGLVSGNLEAYQQNTRGRVGENFVQLKGFVWKGRRWNFTAGDFRMPGTAVTFPFQNYFVPLSSFRGGQADVQQGNRTYSVFAGQETLSAGPRISFRIRVPQNVLGASVRQTLGHLELGARYLHLSSPESAVQDFPSFFPVGREFRAVDTLNLGAYYVRSTRLKFYSDVTLSRVDFLAGFPAAPASPLSFLEGMIYDTRRLTVRANYGRQSTSYLPILGYYSGDRRGPFTDFRLRLTRYFEIYGSGSLTRNNVERNPLAPNYHAEAASGGTSLGLPLNFNLSGQYSILNLKTVQPDPAVPTQILRNAEYSATLARPFAHHSLRLTFRQLRLNSTYFRQKQPVAEIEDTVNYSRFTAGAAVRYQQVNSGQLQNSIFFRGTLQVRLGRFNAYGQAEIGNDLVNKSVFATNTINTTVVGVNYSGFHGWNFSGEVFRNSLTSLLNPVSLFALESQGVGVSTVLSDLNQWSALFRITRRFQWGAPLPEAADQFTFEQLPLVGALEGFVKLPGSEALQGVAEIPVLLDGGRATLTDVSGHYRFEEVPEGPHHVEVNREELPAEYEPASASPAPVMIRSRKITRADLEIVLHDSAVRGMVEGDPKDAALTSLVITLSPGNRMTTADEDGRFNFFNLAAGEYELTVDETTLPENFVLLPPKSVIVTTSKDKTPEAKFTIEMHAPQLPIRKVFDSQSETLP